MCQEEEIVHAVKDRVWDLLQFLRAGNVEMTTVWNIVQYSDFKKPDIAFSLSLLVQSLYLFI